MTTGTSSTAEAIAGLLKEGLRQVESRGTLLNEATTLDLLIKPALEALGYPASYRIPEHGEGRNRLDDSCYLMPVTTNPGYAAVIVEAKAHGTDFDHSRPGQGRFGSPDRQIQRYLKQHSASGPNTLGVLTDGAKWRIYRRKGSQTNPDIEFLAEYDLRPLTQAEPAALPGLNPELRERLTRLVDWLSRESIAYRTTAPLINAAPANPANKVLSALADDSLSPDAILREFIAEPAALVHTSLADEGVNLQGIRRDAHDADWAGYAYAKAANILTDNPELFEHRAVMAAVQIKYVPSNGLARPDVALCARTFAAADPSRAAIILAYTRTPENTTEARLAVAGAGQVNMTAAFDPELAAPSARLAVEQLLRLLQRPGDGLTVDKLMAPLEASPLRQQFYREVAQWTGRRQKGKALAQRQAILRHLVRAIFSWILKEEDIIPPEIFEQAFAVSSLPDVNSYHREILRFLFHDRLNVPEDKREDHANAAVNEAMESVPFLNGSLFAEHTDDDQLDISASEYWSADEEEPGLFTIFSRYHWTMDEHRPGESEQTLDPELLSNLFERLITPTLEGTEPPLRQPQGTYYTPADVADEMVKDALAAAVRQYVPSNVTDAQLLDFFGAADERLDQLDPAEKDKLARRIKELRIFDPAVGSGEFLFSILVALQRALRKLEPKAPNPAADIIKRQLSGQDINPLAVQITRLRLFIAITAARRGTPDNLPLPNLEARIVCADTLETVADPNWRPDRLGQLGTDDPELVQALAAVAENRANWFDAHTEETKQELLQRDAELRSRLQCLLQQKGDLASPELVGFVQAQLYDKNPVPARTDVRLLFYEHPWRGFDIVIGNPPYTDLDRAARQRLNQEKHYRTTNVGDLYSLFCETALALANPVGGVVTLIVPLSVAFGQRQKSLRDIFGSRCREINLRQYNNNPSMMFHTTPTIKDPRNRQRVTIVTSVLDIDQSTLIRSTGLQRWPADERTLCLAQRRTTELPKLGSGVDSRVAGQWLRIPTKEVADMVKAITGQDRTVMSYLHKVNGKGEFDGELLAFPQAAEYFISPIPEGAVTSRRDTLFGVTDQDTLRLLMATLNGHVGYAWWWVVGDGFDMKPIADHGTLTVPNIWSKNPAQAIELGQRLIDAMPECEVEITIHQKVWKNVNFHLKPDLIAELDRLHLEALGLPVEPLLTHLRIMRSSSSWNYGGK